MNSIFDLYLLKMFLETIDEPFYPSYLRYNLFMFFSSFLCFADKELHREG